MSDTDYVRYAVIGNQVIINSGASVNLLGDLGYRTTLTNNGTLTVSGQTNSSSQISTTLTNMTNDFTSLTSLSSFSTNASADIGGSTFTPGAYQFTHAGGITISSNVTLSGNGTYIFYVFGGSLSTSTASSSVSILLTNGAKATQVYWLVKTSVTLQTTGNNITTFAGTVICTSSITVNNSSTNTGSLCSTGTGVTSITLGTTKITSTYVQQPRDYYVPKYINLESTVPNDPSITILAGSPTGGISMDAGDMINIGTGPTGHTINIGTSTTATKTVNIGAPSGSTGVSTSVYIGCGSQGTITIDNTLGTLFFPGMVASQALVTNVVSDVTTIPYQAANGNSTLVSRDATTGWSAVHRNINAQTGTSYTLALADTDTMVTMNNSAASLVLIPLNNVVGFPTGCEIDIAQLNTGQVGVTGNNVSVTVNSYLNLFHLAGQYAAATIKKTGTDTWLLTGNLT